MTKYQGVSVSGELVAASLPSGHLPETAKFQHAFFDYERNVFVCIFEDASFSPVPEGSKIPIDYIDTSLLGGDSKTQWRYIGPDGNEITASAYIEKTQRHLPT